MKIRPMELQDCEAAVELTQAEGWPHTVEDWRLHLRVGRGWGAWDGDGQLLGTVLWWPYGDSAATLGLVVVRKAARGRRIGKRLIKAAMREAAGRSFSLIATPAALRVYRDFGFVERGFVLQYQGSVPQVEQEQMPSEVQIRKLVPTDREQIIQLDANGFGASREQLLDAILESGGGYVAEMNSTPVGFALVRLSGRGTVIGPLVAHNQQAAKALVAQALSETEGFVRIDVPGYARELAYWLEAIGLPRVDQGTVMVRGDIPQRKTTSYIFSVASQALG